MVSFLGSLIITLILVVIRVNSKSFPQNYLDDDYASRRLARWNMLGALRTQDTSPDNAITEIVEEKRDDLPGSNIVVGMYICSQKRFYKGFLNCK